MHEIAYLEFSAEDHASTVDYFAGSLGFVETAICKTPGSTSTLLCQGTIWLVVSSGAAHAAFLERHGDGISDIAFSCSDVPAAIERAMSAGARRLGPSTLSGFGGVRHTLVPPKPNTAAGHTFPDERLWTPVPARSGGCEGFVRGLDHIAVLVEAGTLYDTVRYYEDGFGFKQYSSEYVEVGAQAMDSVVVRSGSGRSTFTIIEPDAGREAGQVDGFLRRNGGAGVQHLAFDVEHIVTAVREYRERGVEFLTTPDAYYAMLTGRVGHLGEFVMDLRDTDVLADRDEWGYLLQLFTRSPLPRNTIFYELIQRNGAKGFGSANIRALYESVERERETSELTV